jgi:HNH endonuclease
VTDEATPDFCSKCGATLTGGRYCSTCYGPPPARRGPSADESSPVLDAAGADGARAETAVAAAAAAERAAREVARAERLAYEAERRAAREASRAERLAATAESRAAQEAADKARQAVKRAAEEAEREHIQKVLETLRQARAQAEQEEADRLSEARAIEAARIAEARAIEDRYGPPSRLIGLQQTSEAFECVECGRWADVPSTAEVYSNLVQTRLGLSLSDWTRVRSAAASTTPLRPAFLQRELGKSYVESVATIDAAVGLGLFDVMKKGVVAAQPRCAPCYERRAVACEPSQSEPKARDPIPPQLRFRVLQRDGFRCQYCGRSPRDGATLHLDHVVPASVGGETSEENLITACETCNLGKSAGSVV